MRRCLVGKLVNFAQLTRLLSDTITTGKFHIGPDGRSDLLHKVASDRHPFCGLSQNVSIQRNVSGTDHRND